LVANEIFLNSRRNKKPFIRVNCAAISETLIESEFFGHERGSFTGATERRDGRFELADGGTILLDEVSEIPLALQAKLLRVLQEREFERVGGNKTIQVDVRVLATTNRDLPKAVANGEFREDLYYRLNVFPLHVPALRERVEDVEELARCFLGRFGRKHGSEPTGFSPAALAALKAHRWPGNVRELQNVVERASILGEKGCPIGSELLGLDGPIQAVVRPAPAVVVDPVPVPAPPQAQPRPEGVAPVGGATGPVLPLHEVERLSIFAALESTGGNRTQAAALLQISIRTLRNKLTEYRGAAGGAVGAEEGADGAEGAV
jgi:transcriptional regulator with GAF, ATPase, and Fis domain